MAALEGLNVYFAGLKTAIAAPNGAQNGRGFVVGLPLKVDPAAEVQFGSAPSPAVGGFGVPQYEAVSGVAITWLQSGVSRTLFDSPVTGPATVIVLGVCL